MKYLSKIPFIRIWANLLVFKGKESKKEYIVDYLCWLVIALAFLIASIVFYYKIINTEYQKLIIPLFFINYSFYRLSLLAMTARRLKDSGNPWKLCFLIFTPFGCIWAGVVCCFANSKEEVGENYRRQNKKAIFGPSLAFAIICVVTLPIRLIVFGLWFIDVPLGNTDIAKSFDIEKYDYYRNRIKGAEEGLPTLDDLGNYSNAYFAYRQVVYSFIVGFSSDGISLFADYSDVNDYNLAKEFANSRYSFIKEPIIQDDSKYTFPVSSFVYKGYSFQISYTEHSVYHSANDEKKEHIYPKSFSMVGFDDVNNSIAYLYYYDLDLDYLCDKNATIEERNKCMPELIEEAFYWRK